MLSTEYTGSSFGVAKTLVGELEGVEQLATGDEPPLMALLWVAEPQLTSDGGFEVVSSRSSSFIAGSSGGRRLMSVVISWSEQCAARSASAKQPITD